jgi:hypothetical protein
MELIGRFGVPIRLNLLRIFNSSLQRCGYLYSIPSDVSGVSVEDLRFKSLSRAMFSLELGKSWEFWNYNNIWTPPFHMFA